MYLLLTVIFVCLTACQTAAQVTSGKNRIALKSFADGEKALDEGNLLSAEKYFLKAYQEEPIWFEPLVKLGAIYFQKGDYVQSQLFFEKAISIDSLSEPLIYLKLGEMAMANRQYSTVIQRLSEFLAFENSSPTLRDKAEKHLRDTEFLANNPPIHKLEITPLPAVINTEALEYLPSLPARADVMIFTRRVRGQEDFYQSIFRDGNWQPSTPISHLNTPDNEGAHCLSADGTMLIYTACGRRDGLGSCDLYYSMWNGQTWSAPANLGPSVNSKHWDGQPSLSATGKTLYFSSERPGGLGGRDLWMINRRGSGWGNPINLSAVNTKWNEESPFIHAADEHLYFMSDGYPGFGGMDLFVSKRKNGAFTKPVNLGSPINSELDEGALHISLDGRQAYFARAIPQVNKATPLQVDIFEFEVPREIRPTPATYVSLQIIDAQTKKPVQGEVKIINLQSDKIYLHALTDRHGKLLACLPAGIDFALTIDKKDYAFYSDYFNLLDTSILEKPRMLVADLVPLKNIVGETTEVSKPIVLNNIFFETGSAQLLAKSNHELAKLLELLNNHPEIRIKILGHTDDVGSDDDNDILSEARAKAIFDYLIRSGIKTDRLSYQGFGESQPVADNSTALGREKNRRTEFIIER